MNFEETCRVREAREDVNGKMLDKDVKHDIHRATITMVSAIVDVGYQH